MDTVVIKHKDDRGHKEYKIYTKEEADSAGIKYVHWYDAEEGEYALSDDGYVGIVITAKWYKDHADRKNSPMNKYVRTVYGVSYYKPERKTAPLTYKDRENPYSLKGKNELVGARKKRGKEIAKVYARTFDLDYSIDEVMRRNPTWSHWNWKNWCKKEEFKDMVGNELTKLLAEKGFDRAQTLEVLKTAVGLAEKKGNVNALLKAVELLLKMHGIDKPAETKIVRSLEAKKQISGYLEDANKEEEMIELRQTQTETTTDVASGTDEEKEIVDEQ